MDILKNKNSIALKVLISLIIFIILGSVFILPASAKSDTLVFNIWNKYRNSIVFVDYAGNDHANFTNDNLVKTDSDVTTFQNAVPISDDLNYPYFKTMALSVPIDALTPQFYISNMYAGKKYTMSCSVLCSSDQPDNSVINNIRVDRASCLLYTGASSSEYISGKVSNLSTKNINSSSFICNFDITFKFPKPTFIYGFWFGLHGNFDFNVNGAPLDYYSFNVKYTLSSLNFTNDLTQDEIQNIINGSTYQIIENDNKNAQDTQDAIKDGADQISDTIREENEKEKEEASKSDKLAGQLTDALGDPSAPLKDSIQTLANSFAYNGTECVFTWPEFKLPNINVAGTNIGGLTVWNSQDLNVTQTIENFLPDLLLLVVRGLFTISLAIFCVVEVMDIILGVLTAFSVKTKV